jgi:oligopeptide transport system substrate-binding protein
MPNSPDRQRVIDAMVGMVRHDAPWIFGFHPKEYSLRHSWLANAKPNDMAGNTTKYLRLDVPRREALRREWNRPVVLPAVLITLALVLSAIPAVLTYRRRERMAARPAS